MSHILQASMLQEFQIQLEEEEKSKETISKYLRDVQVFIQHIGIGNSVTKENAIQYKQILMERYAPSSVNSMLAAVNRFFREQGWYDCMVKSLKIQRDAFRSKDRELSKEEYLRLLEAAGKKGNKRLYLLMETLGSTGIRIGELKFITVEAIQSGCATVTLKRKTRRVMLPDRLRKNLSVYVKEQGIKSGSVFVTRTGKVMDRSNILHEMKALSRLAGVARDKVFPHNLRHLFACTFYRIEKDLSRLADLLGHSNINTTRIYTCISGEEHVRQMERLGLTI